MHAYSVRAANDSNAFCLFWPFLQLTTSWCSLAAWLRTCSPWTTTTPCVHYKPFPLPFPVLTASWLVSKGVWVSILSKEAISHMIPNSCWCRCMVRTKKVREKCSCGGPLCCWRESKWNLLTIQDIQEIIFSFFFSPVIFFWKWDQVFVNRSCLSCPWLCYGCVPWCTVPWLQ